MKVMSNEVELKFLCCGMCFTCIHLFVATHHDIKTFTKGFVEKARVHNARLKIKTRRGCFYNHCISEGTLSLENVRCHFHCIFHVMPDKAEFVSSAYSPTTVTGRKPLMLVIPL